MKYYLKIYFKMNIRIIKSQMLSVMLIVLLSLSLNLFSQNGLSVNTSGVPADNSAILDVSSTSQGLLIPRLTTEQRDNISSPALSLLIFNTTTNCFEAYVNGSWYSFSCPADCTPQCGTQVWTCANLNVGTMISSTTGGNLQTNNGTVEKYCYNNVASNCDIYGGLYEWDETMSYASAVNCDPCGPTTGHGGVQGICPSGYHLPSYAEWDRYISCIGANAGEKMKASGPVWDGTNTSGFTAIMSPYRYSPDGTFHDDHDTHIWTTSETPEKSGWCLWLTTGDTQAHIPGCFKADGMSVRCLKD
jgi:uncharacterized protein (TIGR02145 family)